MCGTQVVLSVSCLSHAGPPALPPADSWGLPEMQNLGPKRPVLKPLTHPHHMLIEHLWAGGGVSGARCEAR